MTKKAAGMASGGLCSYFLRITLQILNADTMIVGIRGHLSIGYSQLDERCPGAYLVIIGELHRTDSAFAVADYTIFVEYAANFTVVGYGVFGISFCDWS